MNFLFNFGVFVSFVAWGTYTNDSENSVTLKQRKMIFLLGDFYPFWNYYSPPTVIHKLLYSLSSSTSTYIF